MPCQGTKLQPKLGWRWGFLGDWCEAAVLGALAGGLLHSLEMTTPPVAVAAGLAPGVNWEGWGQPSSLLTTPVLELGLVLDHVPCGNCALEMGSASGGSCGGASLGQDPKGC